MSSRNRPPAGPAGESVRAGRGGNETSLTRYFSDIRDFPTLDREAELDLVRTAQDGDAEAFERLVESNLRFVVKIARDYAYVRLPIEDLINEGNLGLIDAVMRFDSERGVRFITWAVWWIRRSMRRAILEQNHVVRLPRLQVQRLHELRETTDTLTKELGRRPRQDELKQRLSFDPTKLQAIQGLGLATISLDKPRTTEDPRPVGAGLVDDRITSAEDQAMQNEVVALVRQACEALSEHEQTVIAERFGFDNDEAMTLGTIGEQLDLSRERIRQIEFVAKERVRRRYLSLTRRPLRSQAASAVKPAKPSTDSVD